MDTWDNRDPFSDNTNLNVRFHSLSLSEAEFYAEMLVSIIEQFLIVDFSYGGYNSFDDWYGDEWLEVVEIYYNGHADWTSCINTYENALPVEKGGIAAAVDMSEASSLRFNAWYDGGLNDFVGSISLSFNPVWDTLFGSHAFSLKEMLHLTQFQVSSEATDWFLLIIELPDVTNLVVTPWLNEDYINMGQDYHPNIEEPWYLDHTYNVWVDIAQGYNIADFNLNFDFDVLYWETIPTERADYQVDARGYSYKRIEFRGPNAHLDVTPFNELLLSDVWEMCLNYNPNAFDIAVHPPLYLDINYVDTNDHQTSADGIADYFETLLGSSFTYNDSLIEWRWDDKLQTQFETIRYYYGIEIYNLVDFNALLQSSLAYQYSSMINSSTMLSSYTDFRWNIRYDSYYNIFGYRVELVEYSLDEYIQDPIKTYTETALPIDHSFDILTLFGWTTLPYSALSYRHEISLNLPVSDDSDITIVPGDPNGWGYHYYYWIDNWNLQRNVRLDINYYVQEPWTTDEFGVKIDPITNWVGTFNNDFKSDTIDLDQPGIGGLSFYNVDYWDYDLESGFSGLTILSVDVWDTHMDYWDVSESNWIPRFPSSGILEVTGDLFYGDLAFDIEGFYIPVIFEYNSTYNRYISTIDFSAPEFADGDWLLTVEAEDNSNNIGWNYYDIYVDNFDDILYDEPALVEWVPPTPDEFAAVAGEITISVNVTDDVGVYSVILWTNFGGYPLEDPDLDGIYSMVYDTTYDFDGSLVLIAEVWDFEGHYSAITRDLEIDNYPSGDPPTLSIISPTEGETINETYLVQALVTDDIGIKAVSLTVDDRAPVIMTYNEISGYFETLYITTQLSDGYHSFTITVIDEDENTHFVSQTVNVYVNNGGSPMEGNPPEYNLVNVPINQTQEELQTQINQVTDESKAISGTFNWQVEVRDDIGISQVGIAIDDQIYVMSGSDSGPNMWSMWVFEWDSTRVNDGAHIAIISITDIDSNQHEIQIIIGFTTSNGNTKDDATIGIDGFEALWVIFAILPITVSLRFVRKQRNKL